MAPIFVPMFMLLGYAPEMVQAGYRIGDSVTNIISPMMSYFALIIAFFQRYEPKAGLGTLVVDDAALLHRAGDRVVGVVRAVDRVRVARRAGRAADVSADSAASTRQSICAPSTRCVRVVPSARCAMTIDRTSTRAGSPRVPARFDDQSVLAARTSKLDAQEAPRSIRQRVPSSSYSAPSQRPPPPATTRALRAGLPASSPVFCTTGCIGTIAPASTNTGTIARRGIERSPCRVTLPVMQRPYHVARRQLPPTCGSRRSVPLARRTSRAEQEVAIAARRASGIRTTPDA
jgi:hypothetical protein